jgi:hypothetical protein|tara:strand:- start:874 stop:990 length:117 start_codon:yes stop_codon:yes gene_type:complete
MKLIKVNKNRGIQTNAGVAELVDALDLGSSDSGISGSN